MKCTDSDSGDITFSILNSQNLTIKDKNDNKTLGSC